VAQIPDLQDVLEDPQAFLIVLRPKLKLQGKLQLMIKIDHEALVMVGEPR